MVLRVTVILFACSACAPAPDSGARDAMVDSIDAEGPMSQSPSPDRGIVWDQGTQDATVSAPVLDNQAIQAAGNAAIEVRRYEILREYRSRLTGDTRLAQDLDALLPFIDRWANGREKYWAPGEQEMAGEGGYLAGYFLLHVWPGNTFPADIESTSPLYPIWCLYRGRMLIWAAIQNGVLVEEFFSEARELLGHAYEAFPENPILGMYLDEPIPWVSPFEADPRAPRWANLQRDALHKLKTVVEFWIEQRQAEDGQFGGGWGDDVEMWRWWTPLLLGFAEPEIIRSQERLAEGVHALPRMAEGYTSIMTDVEHSSEDSSDTIVPLMQLRPDHPEWTMRARRIAELMDTLWLGDNERGERQFRSTYFTSTEVDSSEEHACDTPYHTRAAAPAFLYWLVSDEPEVGHILRAWLDTWVAASLRRDGGKPEGLLPAAIRFPSGLTGGANGLWWDPRCHFTPVTFRWPRGLDLLSQALIIAYLKTNDEEYLTPLFYLVSQRDAPDENAEEGSLPWAMERLGNKFITALAKFRLATGDSRFDHVLRGRASAYVQSRITNQTTGLENALQSLVDALAVDEAAHTTEVRFTDRVFKFHRKYANQFRDNPVGGVNMNVLYEMITGDFGPPNILPLAGVKWITAPEDIAVLVTRNETRNFDAEIFIFGDVPKRVGARLLRLEHGRYRWRLDGDRGVEDQGDYRLDDAEGPFYVSVPAGQRVSLSLSWSP